MYELGAEERAIKLEHLPQSDAGSPRPCVFATERRVVLAYYLQTPEIWTKPQAELARESDFREKVAIVEFKLCFAHLFGPT